MSYLRALTIGLLIVPTLPVAAAAGCATSEDTFLSCTIRKTERVLAVCVDGDQLTYQYGLPGAPELTLSEPLAAIDYQPWNGVGRSIWEEVRFANGATVYAVHGGLDRVPNEDETRRLFGGIEILQDGKTLGQLTCLPDTVVFPWTDRISEARRAAGFEWGVAEMTWVKRAD